MIFLTRHFKQQNQINSPVLHLKENSHNYTSNDRTKKIETVSDNYCTVFQRDDKTKLRYLHTIGCLNVVQYLNYE